MPDSALMLNALSEYWEHTSDIAFIKDLKGVYIVASSAFAQASGLSHRQEVVGKTDYDIFEDHEIAQRYADDDARLLSAGGALENYIELLPSRSGETRYCLYSKYLLKDKSGKPMGIMGLSRDITREYEARRSYENELRNFLELPSDAIYAVMLDLTSWRVVDVRVRSGSDEVKSQYYTVDEFFSLAVDSVVHDSEVRDFFAGITQRKLRDIYENGQRSIEMEYLRRFLSGKTGWVRAELRFLNDPVNCNLSLIILLRDIDESMREYSELVTAAAQDPMTGLLNRRSIAKQINEFLETADPSQIHALFMIDVDDFKNINDSFGHQYGDSVIKDTADAITSVFRSSDLIARMGGDEFMVLMKDVGSGRAALRKAEELISALQFSARSSTADLELSSSAGIALFKAGEKNFTELYDEADSALYQAKNSGKNRFMVFRPERRSDAPKKSEEHSGAVDTVHIRTLLENMDGGVILAEVEDDIRITYVSPSLFTSFDRSTKNVGDYGENIMSLIVPADLPKVREAVFQTAKNNEIMEISYRVIAENGDAWRHLRAKRIPESPDGIPRVIAVITDITHLKSIEENLRETEMRYRTAVEQTDVMLWEVDIPSRTITLTGPAWESAGFEASVFPNAPEGYLNEGRITADTADDFRRMFADICSGKQSATYYCKVHTEKSWHTWVKLHYKLLRDDKDIPYRALCVTLPVANINAEMRRFEQEERFADIAGKSLAGHLRCNLTKNKLELAYYNGSSQGKRDTHADLDKYLKKLCAETVHESDAQKFLEQASTEALLAKFHAGESWGFFDYQRKGAVSDSLWTNLFFKLMRHPISGDVYSFCYLRDKSKRHSWEVSLGIPPQRDAALLLYTQDYMQALSRHILSISPSDSRVSVFVMELLGLDKVKEELGSAAAEEVMLTFSRLCRIAIEGDIVAGKLDDNRIAVLYADAGSAEAEHERVTNTIAVLKELLGQAHPDAGINLIGGFAVEKVGKTSYDALKRMALVACRNASRTLGESAVGYADTGIEAGDIKETAGLAERYRALELRFQQQVNLLRSIESDPLSGLLGRQAFYRRVRELLDLDTDERYAIVRFDINRFKVYNDVRGTEAGDQLLRDIAEQLKLHAGPAELIARLESDHFALFTVDSQDAIEKSQAMLSKMIATLTPGFRLTGTVGVYSIEDPSIDVSLMCDRALLALRSVKSGFETRIAYYDKTLRDHLLEEQDLMDDMEPALESGQFELYFQPQVNYEDGTLVGAEALVRWNHPTRGLLSPGVFIPLFEKNGLITRLDEYVWDKCCYYIRRWTDAYPESAAISISVNVSRLDINDLYLCNKLRNIVQKHGLTPAALHLEITESAYMDSPQRLIDAVRRLKVFGFTVEMDDFGSGFSSLNTLKDVIVDVLKLDMQFLSSCDDSSRGGSILGSVIRMAHWLKLPVIAEGVETREQADYLKSLGCLYMQGYHFDAPMPAANFEKLLASSAFSKTDRYSGVNLEGVAAFWDSSAQTTLLFNSYVGGAAIIEYANEDVSIVRANDRFYSEIGTTSADYVDKQQHTVNRFDEKNAATYIAMIKEAVSTGDEAECELQSLPHNHGDRPLWTHLRARPLAKNSGVWLLYLTVENITERKLLEEERDAENERSRLLLQSTRTALLDYDVASDTLSYQTYLPDSGIVNRSIDKYYNYLLGSPSVNSTSIAAIRSIISKVSSPPVRGEFECLVNIWGTGMRWCRVNYVGVEDSNGQVYRIVGQAVDVNDKKERDELEEAMSLRLNSKNYSHTYSDIIVNQIYGLFYGSTDIERAIETTLALLGEYYELSRSYIFEDSDDHSHITNTFEWCSHDISPEKDGLQNLTYDALGGRDYIISRFDEKGTFYCPDIKELGDEARAVLEPQGICSMLQYAILDNGVFSGMVGFDECRAGRVWSDEMTGTLMFVSRIIGSFLTKLRQSDSAAFSSDFRAALDNNSAFIYIIDPDTYEVIYTNQAIQQKDGTDHIGKTCYKKFMGLSEPCEQCPLRQLLDNGPSVAEVQRPDGMLLLAQASPLRWNGRDMVMLSYTDISESKRA